MQKSLIAVALGAALVLAPAAPAAAHPPVITGHSASLHPEGVAYDPYRDGFLVTSLKHGTVSTVDRHGRTRVLVGDPGLISTIGVHVDAARDRVLVAGSDNGVGDRTGPATAGRTAQLGIYSLSTGARLSLVDLAAVGGDGGHFANDIAVAPDGTAYVTDSAAGIVYRVTTSGNAEVLVRDTRLSSPDGNGANGIVLHDGVLIVGNFSAGTLWRVPLTAPADVRQVRVAESLVGVDGLTLEPDGTILAVTNSLGGGPAARVRELRPSRDWTSATVVESRAWPDNAPTTAAVRHGAVYVLDGEMDVLLSGAGTSDEFTLRRF